MDRIIAVLVLFTITFHAEARIRPLGHFFKLVPESEAHTSQGITRDHDFDRNSIKVLVWNVKKSSMKPWKNEFTNFGEGKDLFLIQEAYQNNLFNSTLNSFENVRWDMGVSFLYTRFNNTATGNMLGSRVEPTFINVLHTPDFEPVVATPKATTIGKYAIEGSSKELLVISVHGINLTSFGAFKRHMEQAKQLIETHDGPVLFAGDFNTRTNARTQHLMELTKSLGLQTVGFKNGECRMKFKFTPYYLDHSFVRGLTVKNSEVDCQSRGSDHRPMMLELAVAE
jgi:endonuclease/exonuclease/phosphatase (EEP) superfamily protein YafD